MSRSGYRPETDPWRAVRCQRPECLHLAAQHHGDGGECRWCGGDCPAYVAPTEDFLRAVAEKVAAHHDSSKEQVA